MIASVLTRAIGFLTFKKIRVRKAEGYLLEKYFEEYMQTGGIPEYVTTGDVSYLDNLIESLIYKNIIACHGVRDVQGIKDFFRLLMERAGKLFTVNKVAKITGFRDKGAIFENLLFLKIKHKQPCYVYRNGVELDFLAGDILLEAKYNSDLNAKQQALFDAYDARHKHIIRNIRDFLDLEVP
jgi:predicted AAA+ superfamily ATPase